LQPDRRWESVANVQAAAGLRVRLWLSIRAEVKALGAANGQVIACRILRATAVEENCMPMELASRPQITRPLSQYQHKGLNLRDDSKRTNCSHIPHRCLKKFS